MRADVMVDLETLAIDKNCVILSIGACQFDIETGNIGNCFYSILDIQKQIDNGRVISASTLKWWINQSIHDPKSADIFNSRTELSLDFVLNSLARFIPKSDTKVWSNGASFDCAVLEQAYGDNLPWWFSRTRDTRTILDVADLSGGDFEFKGTAHNALADAIHQAKYVSAAWQKLRGIENVKSI